jgi:hypothetical protein
MGPAVRKAMKTPVLILFSLFLACVAGEALAGPPQKVIYREGKATKFNWEWPYHTTQTKTYLQTKPYYQTRKLVTKYAGENVSRYRHHYQHKTHLNEWGYWFPKGTRLDPKMVIQFGPVEPQHRVRATAALGY